MASGDLLRQMLLGHMKRDDAVFKAAAEAIIQEERAKNHRLLADDLERILVNGSRRPGDKRLANSNYDVPRDKERGFPLLEIAEFTYDWDRLILPAKTVEQLRQVALEHHRRDL